VAKALVFGSLGLLLVFGSALSILMGGLSWFAKVADDPVLRILGVSLVVVAGLFGLLFIAAPHVTAWAASKRRDVLGPRQIRIGADGLHVVTQSLTSVVAWSGLTRVEVLQGDVHLYLSASEAVLIPGHAFETLHEREAFVKECATRLAADRITKSD
jgi:hypothetical protein